MEIFIGFKLRGFNEFQREIRDMIKRAEELEQTKTVSFEELFVPAFMSKYTDFSTFEELLDAGGFEVNSQEDFQNIPDDVFDDHVSKHTKFDTWQEMLDTAVQEYAARKLGF